MANDTVNIRPGALKQAIKKAGISQNAFAEKVPCSRSTLQTIDAGKAIKTETLLKVTNALGIPDTHLLAEVEKPADDGPDQLIVEEDDVFGTLVELRLPRISTTDDLRKTLANTKKLYWKLQVNDVSDDLGGKLIEFEQHVASFNKNELRSTSDSLAGLVETKKQQRRIGDHIQELVELGVHLYGSTYLKWQKEEDRYADCLASEYPGWVDFRSERMAILVLDSRNNLSIREDVHTGYPPPRYASAFEPRIKVNDQWLQTKEEAEKAVTDLDARLAELLGGKDIPF